MIITFCYNRDIFLPLKKFKLFNDLKFLEFTLFKFFLKLNIDILFFFELFFQLLIDNLGDMAIIWCTKLGLKLSHKLNLVY